MSMRVLAVISPAPPYSRVVRLASLLPACVLLPLSAPVLVPRCC